MSIRRTISTKYALQLLNTLPDGWTTLEHHLQYEQARDAAVAYIDAWREPDQRNPPPFPREVRVAKIITTEQAVFGPLTTYTEPEEE